MLKIYYEILDGCSYNRSEQTRIFENMDAFKEYEKSMNNSFYDIYIKSIETIKKED